MVAAVEFQKDVASAGIFCIIMGKFGYCQEFSLIILFQVDKNLEVDFYSTDLLFSLAVNLGVKDCWKFLLDFQEVTKRWPEFWGEKRILFTNNWVK